MNHKLNVVIAAVAFAAVTQVSAQEVVKIGHVGPTSGGIAHLGKDNENGARMAVDELNAKGVTIGGKETLVSDTCIPDEAWVLTKEAWCANRLPARLPNRAQTTKTRVRSPWRSIDSDAAAVLESRMARSMRPVRLSTRLPITARVMSAAAWVPTAIRRPGWRRRPTRRSRRWAPRR